MRCRIGVHRTQDANVIGELRRVWKEAADRQTTLATGLERKWRLHQMPNRPAIGPNRFHLSGIRPPVKFGQRRLRVERVHLAGRAIHKQKNDMLRLGEEMCRLWCQWIVIPNWRPGLDRGKETVSQQNFQQFESGETCPRLPEKLPPPGSAWAE